MILIAARWPRIAVVMVLLYLPIVALIRRLLIEDAGWTSLDPLLAVGPIVTLFLLYRTFTLERRPLVTDLLSGLMVALILMTIVQSFNPLASGGLLAGIVGMVFLGIPLSWFFIGRSVADRRLVSFLVPAIIIMALVAGAYGIKQMEIGPIPSWDQTWFEIAGYDGLKASSQSNNELRPWATFSSNSEYSAYIAVALMFCFALFFHGRWWTALAAVPLAFAVFFAGGRAVLALTLIAAAVLTGLRTRNAAMATLVVIAGVGVALAMAATIGPALDDAAGVSGDAIVERQVGGLLNPLDPNKSTFLSHWDGFLNGMWEGIKNPAGRGTAFTTRAGGVVGEGVVETDNDMSDLFISFGFLGGLLYFVFVMLALVGVFRRYIRGHDLLVFAVAGLMIVTLGQWTNGGHYALASYTFFFIGWATRPEDDPDRKALSDEPDGET
jgi:hypothetical protein